MSPDGKVLASGGWDKKLCIYDTDTYAMTASINCHEWVNSLCFVNNSVVLAGINYGEMIAVEVQTGEVIKDYEGKFAIRWYRSQTGRYGKLCLYTLYRYLLTQTHTRQRRLPPMIL